MEAERRQRIREVLHRVRPALEQEIGTELEISNDGNDLVLVSNGEIRFRAALAPNGRVIVTDLRSGDHL